MKRQVSLFSRAVAALLTLVLYVGTVAAQETPRTADGHPDLTGFGMQAQWVFVDLRMRMETLCLIWKVVITV